MSGAELRVAVVGGWGHFSILPGLTERGNARLVAIAGDGKDESAGKYLDADFGKGLPYFKSCRRMLDHVKPDIVSVGVQPARNAHNRRRSVGPALFTGGLVLGWIPLIRDVPGFRRDGNAGVVAFRRSHHAPAPIFVDDRDPIAGQVYRSGLLGRR